MKLVSSLALTLGVLALAAACGGGGSGPGGEGGGIVLTAPSDEVIAGFTIQVVAAASDRGATALTWSTSSAHLATVDQTGLVLGCTTGSVTITARSPQTGAVGTIALRVVPDAAFNTALPTDAAPFAPVVKRKSSVEQCVVELHVDGIAATIVEAHHRLYHRLELPQAGVIGDVGRPELPYYTFFFAIPVDATTHAPATWRVEVERSSPRRYDGIRPWPHQPGRWIEGEVEDDAPPPFVANEAAYAEETAWPEEHWSAEAFQIGNLPLLEVQVAPANYLPKAGILEHYQAVRVHVAFQGKSTLAMPRVVGDYKGIHELSADQLLMQYVQNSDQLHAVEQADLVYQLPPIGYSGAQDYPFDLLIVTHPDLQLSALDLAQHKQEQGLRVWLEIGSATTLASAEALHDRIRGLDDANRLNETGGFEPHALRAVLLFGDVELIPTFELDDEELIPKPTAAEPKDVSIPGTDYRYSLLQSGLDLRPDVALGRISVDDNVEGANIVAKIVAYENRAADDHPHRVSIYGLFDDEAEERTVLVNRRVDLTRHSRVVTASGAGFSFEDHLVQGDLLRIDDDKPAREGSWSGRVAHVVSATEIWLQQPWTGLTVDDEDEVQVGYQDGQDDWMFLETAERVRDFMDDIGVIARWGYQRNDLGGLNPTPTHDYDGDPLHPDLVDYEWDCDTNEIETRWQQGYDGIVLHSDHGEPTGWKHPPFHVGDIPEITGAGGWFPIVFSINCSSGFFDSETDRKWVWDDDAGEAVAEATTGDGHGTHDESFCEALLRRENGGGVAAVAASRGTTSRFNDKLVDGLFGAIYAEYTRGVIVEGPGTRYAFEYLGEAVLAAKFTMYHAVASATHGYGKPKGALRNMYLYHLFGDPMLRVRPPQPSE